MGRASMIVALDAAINAAGGAMAVARFLKVSRQAVRAWKICPPHHVLKLEKFSGTSRHKLRPDLYPDERLEARTG